MRKFTHGMGMVLAALALLAFTGLGRADTAPPAATAQATLTVSYQTDNNGKPTVLAAEGACNDKAYMVVSWYPRAWNSKRWLYEGTHQYYQVGPGTFAKNFPIDTQFLGGAYEVSLWAKKVEKDQCKVPGGCEVCQQLGHHMEGQLAYKTAYIKYVSDK